MVLTEMTIFERLLKNKTVCFYNILKVTMATENKQPPKSTSRISLSTVVTSTSIPAESRTSSNGNEHDTADKLSHTSLEGRFHSGSETYKTDNTCYELSSSLAIKDPYSIKSPKIDDSAIKKHVKRLSVLKKFIGNESSMLSIPSSPIKDKLLNLVNDTPKRSKFESFSVISQRISWTSKNSFEEISPHKRNWHPKKICLENTSLLTGSVIGRQLISQSHHRQHTSYILDKQKSDYSFDRTHQERSHVSMQYLTPNNKRSCAADQTPYDIEKSTLKRKRISFTLPHYSVLSLQTLKSEAGFIDTHCHLDFLFQRQDFKGSFSEYQSMHKDTFPKCYKGCVTIFCNPFTFAQTTMWENILKEEHVWASFGCHPHNAYNYNDEIENNLKLALKHSKVRAVGEIGLDYSTRNKCKAEIQQRVLRRQLKIVLETKLPVIIHCREAHEDGLKILKEVLPNDYVIHLHCFTDTWNWAQKWLEEFPNLHIGITNVVTFPSANTVHEVAKNIPLNRLLLETDAPYFVPRLISHKNSFSHPGMAIHVAAQIAALKNISLDKLLQSVKTNTLFVYNI